MSLRFIGKRQRKKRFRLWLIVLFCLFLIFFFLSGRSKVVPEQEIVISQDLVKVKVWEKETSQLLEMGLEAYVIGVVAAEMPASFPLESLKAQAVAARTYAVQRLQVPDPRVKALHQKADLSSDPAVNQAWISNTEMQKRWGKWNYATHLAKVRQAVEETQGQVLIYHAQLIDPAYHASCGGQRTENSGDVWKYEAPYLRSVACTNHQDRHNSVALSFTVKDCDTLLGTKLTALPTAKFQKEQGVLQLKEKSATGRVKTMVLGGKTFSGSDLRARLNLPSTRFTCHKVKQGLRFTCNGYGHGVGMCQYGAADLATQGKNYREILQHYYTGVEMARIQCP